MSRRKCLPRPLSRQTPFYQVSREDCTDGSGKSKELTNDKNLLLFKTKYLRQITRGLAGLILPCWLIFHVILLYFAEGVVRIVIFALFTTVTSVMVLVTTNASKYNLMVALLTYVSIRLPLTLAQSAHSLSLSLFPILTYTCHVSMSLQLCCYSHIGPPRKCRGWRWK